MDVTTVPRTPVGFSGTMRSGPFDLLFVVSAGGVLEGLLLLVLSVPMKWVTLR